MACFLAGYADEGDAAQFLFHHPFEVAAQESVDKEDVHCTLVVDDEYIRGMAVEMVAPFYFYGQQEDAAYEDAPIFSGVVAPDVSVAHEASDDRCQGRHNRCQQKNGQHEACLVKTIKQLHFFVLCKVITAISAGMP